MKTVTTTTALASVLAVLSATAAAADNGTIRMAERADFRLFEALSTEVPPASLFPYNSGLSTRLPPRFMPAGTVFNKPIPTNNWWGNMIAASTDAQAQPVWSNPYAIRASVATAPFGLTVSYPFASRAFGGSSGNGGANKYYLHAIINDFTFSAREFNGPPTFEVFNWDDLAVSVRVANGGAKMESTLVSGMALTTTKYTQLTPKLDSAHAYLTVNGANVQSGSVVSGNRFVVTLNNGQKWVIYTSASITFTLNGFSSLVANGPFNGWIRSGLVVSDAQLAALDRTRNCLLEGGDVQARDTSNYSFNLKVSGDCSQGLFHYLQVHHMDTLDRASASEVAGAGSNSATRGPMTGVLTKTNPPQLRFVETQNVPAEFYPPRRPAASDVQQQRIKETLISDINAAWNIPLDGSYYFNGKLAQKYASLCLIANDETVTGGDKPSLLRTCLNKLETVLQPFITNSWKYPLHYDTTYRGIVSSQGFFLNDMNADFGNTMYNDHHYHWGYWITTAAIVNFLDPSWSQIKQLNRITSFLVRDVANPSTSDTNFPKFRNFDWFRGHSFSHGVTPFADGKDQESTSEEINFHYGLALFGRVTGDTATANIGQLMLKLNTRSIQNYFLMTNDNRVHPPSIKPNKVTGIFFDNKADYGTWFSAEKYAIHGIQMLPVTAVTEFVRSRQFVQEEWDAVLGREPDVLNVNPTNPWMSILFMNLAVINKPVGLQLLQRVTMDDGLTRSWALYMAATRP